jgi:hypothetical protein
VLLAMGVPEPVARGALRFSLGHTSTEDDVDALARTIGPAVVRARGAGLTSGGASLPVKTVRAEPVKTDSASASTKVKSTRAKEIAP